MEEKGLIGKLDIKRVHFDEECVSLDKRAWLYFMAPVSAGESLLGDTFEPHENTVATEIAISTPLPEPGKTIGKYDILVAASPVDVVMNGKDKEYEDTDWKDCYLTLEDVMELLITAEDSKSLLAGDIFTSITKDMKNI
jgi:hypothetical protein